MWDLTLLVLLPSLLLCLNQTRIWLHCACDLRGWRGLLWLRLPRWLHMLSQRFNVVLLSQRLDVLLLSWWVCMLSQRLNVLLLLSWWVCMLPQRLHVLLWLFCTLPQRFDLLMLIVPV